MQLLIIFLSIVLIITIVLLLFLMIRRRTFGGDNYKRKTGDNQLQSSFVTHSLSVAPVATYLSNQAYTQVTIMEALEIFDGVDTRTIITLYPEQLETFLVELVSGALTRAYRYEHADTPITGDQPNRSIDTIIANNESPDGLRNEDYCRMILGYSTSLGQIAAPPVGWDETTFDSNFDIRCSHATIAKMGERYSFISIPHRSTAPRTGPHRPTTNSMMIIPANTTDIDLNQARDTAVRVEYDPLTEIVVFDNNVWAAVMNASLGVRYVRYDTNPHTANAGEYYESYVRNIKRMDKVTQTRTSIRLYTLIIRVTDEQGNVHFAVIDDRRVSDMPPYLVYKGMSGNITSNRHSFKEPFFITRASGMLVFKDGRLFPFRVVDTIGNNEMIVNNDTEKGTMLYHVNIANGTVLYRFGRVLFDSRGKMFRKNNLMITSPVINGRRTIAAYNRDYNSEYYTSIDNISYNRETCTITFTKRRFLQSPIQKTILDDGTIDPSTASSMEQSILNKEITYGCYLHNIDKYISLHSDLPLFVDYVSVKASKPTNAQSFAHMFDSVMLERYIMARMVEQHNPMIGAIWDYGPYASDTTAKSRERKNKACRQNIIDLIFDPMVTVTYVKEPTPMYRYQPMIYRDKRVKDIYIKFVPCRDGDTIFPFDDSIVMLETDEKLTSNKGEQVIYDETAGRYFVGTPESKKYIDVCTFRIHKHIQAREIVLNFEDIGHYHFMKSICHFLTIMKLKADNSASKKVSGNIAYVLA